MALMYTKAEQAAGDFRSLAFSRRVPAAGCCGMWDRDIPHDIPQ
jgi:hypothetical protein